MHRVAFPLKARLEMTTTGSIELTPDYEGDGGDHQKIKRREPRLDCRRIA